MSSRDAERASSDAPKRVGRYDILMEIASGGMASVYLGRATGMAGFERIVAIKLCHPHLRKDDEFVRMFLDEARLAARIHHPHVVATLDVGESDALFLVMEYIEGDRLTSLMRAAYREGGHMPPEIVIKIFIDVLDGLHAAHELTDATGAPLRIVHRDVSPQNILVGVDGSARITDFGIARAEQRATVTRQGELKGKMGYMAPEQLRGEAADRQADLFATGVVMWEALTSRRLFRGDGDVDTMHRVLNGEIPPVSRFAPDVPAGLDAVVGRALARNKSERFTTAVEMIEALESCGVPAASTRTLAQYVERTIPDVIKNRREMLRAAIEQRAAPAGAQWNDEPISISVVDVAAPAAATAAPVTPAAASTPSFARRAAPVAAVVVLGLILALGWLAQSGQHASLAEATPPAAPPSSVAPAPPAPAAAPPSSAIAEVPPAPASAAPASVVPASVAPAASTVATTEAPPPVAPALAAPAAAPPTHTSGHRARTDAPAPTAPATPPASPPTPPASPAEFHPEAI